ncbi:MAG: polysaccharide deacetylase family protein [Chloroflexota bacterium]|nr:polysaccharide deacetylase family protein [Chloroflexota bacterium]MDQ5865466.1 polysaccharide deacetylase family protein [Chloroflexota bacterium]
MSALYRAIYFAGKPLPGGGITILTYHSLDDLGTPLSVSPRLFKAQMSALSALGCHTLTMSQVAEHLSSRRPFPSRAVAITFDDGFANFADEGVPTLRRYGFSSTVYVITGMVGRMTRWTDGPRALPSLPILTWEQIERLQREGVEIGAHTATHGFLTQYSPAALAHELTAPRKLLEERLGIPVRAFAYPQGDYDDRVVQAVRAAGYATATTVDQGRAVPGSDPLRLPRLLVSNNTTPEIMKAFVVPTIGPAYVAINLVVRGLLGRKRWPRRKPGEVQSTDTVSVPC